jgi:MoaA/NifB/PqqE/SkfB family radical SAM enzyme
MTNALEFPQVEEKFQDGYPEGYRPWVSFWSFTEEEMMETTEDGTFKLLTLDISINSDDYLEEVNNGTEGSLTERAEKFYKCDIGCAHCFECKTHTDNPLMTTEEVFGMLLEAKKLGLKTVKFLGPGELLHNPRLFEILDFLQENGLRICVFTKGLALGSDEQAQKIFGMTAVEFCEKLYRYPNVAVLLSFTSANRQTETSRIDSKKVPDLFDKRNRAFENLAQAGFNSDPDNQRLAAVCTPVLRDNIDEVLEIYKWAISRNIPMVVAPTMVSGKGSDMVEVTDSYFKENQLVELYVDIYTWLIKENILSVAQIEEEGVSSYPGFACNQVVTGMFIRKDGRAQMCPGNEGKDFIYNEDVRKSDLKEIWKNSMGYKLRNQLIEMGGLTLTQPCFAKSEGIEFPEKGVLVKRGEGSIPEGFYKKIMDGIRERIAQTV